MPEAAVYETYPDSTCRIGCQEPRAWNLIRGKFLLDAKLANPKKPAFRTDDADPDILLTVLRNRDRSSQGASVAAVDFPKLAALVDGQQVIDPNPEPPSVVLPKRGNPSPRRADRIDLIAPQNIQAPSVADPHRSVIPCDNR